MFITDNKIIILISLLTLFLLGESCQLKSPKNYTLDLKPLVRDSIKTTVLNDYANKELKFYTFGIAAPSKETIVNLKNCCDVDVKSANCLMDKQLSYYNYIVDSLVLINTGKNIDAFVAN